jgi:hypothetical protein
MLLNDDEIQETIESPLNLLNRLKTSLNRATHTNKTVTIPALPPKAADIIDNLEDKLRDTSTRSKAIGILNSAMDELNKRIPEVEKPEVLARIAGEMSKVVHHQDMRTGGDKSQSQIIIYAPQVQTIDSYEIIDVTE